MKLESHIHNNKSGTTLIELIIYLGIISSFLVAISLFTWDVLQNRASSVAGREVHQSGRFLLHTFGFYGRQAVDFSHDETGMLFTLQDGSMVGFTTHDGIMRISKDNETHPITADSVNVTVSDVTDLSTEGSRHIRIQFTVETDNPSNSPVWDAARDFNTSFELRNPL